MSLLDIIKNIFKSLAAEEQSSLVPEDSMLRRHYLSNLKAQAESKKDAN